MKKNQWTSVVNPERERVESFLQNKDPDLLVSISSRRLRWL